MEAVLMILFNLAILAMAILIFLRFHLDRLVLRIEMRWKAVNSLMRYIVSDEMEVKSFSQEEQQKIDIFLKSRKQGKQVAAVNELSDILTIPSAARADFLQCRNDYNLAVQTFNKKIEVPVWKFVANLFRIKSHIELVEFVAAPKVPDAPEPS